MNLILACCLCLWLGAARAKVGDVMWFGMGGMSEKETSIAIENKVFFGELGFNHGVSLLASSSPIESLFPGAFHLFTVPSSTALCVVKSSPNQFADVVWSSEEIVVLAHATTDDINTRDYSPECFDTNTRMKTRFVPFTPLHPQPQMVAKIQSADHNPIIQEYVDGMSRDSIEKDVQQFSTNYDGTAVNITRNSYSIQIGIGGCDDDSWRCLSHVQTDLQKDLKEILAPSDLTYDIETLTFREDMGPNIRVVFTGTSKDIVVLGAHLDSRNVGAGTGGGILKPGLAPGADDNGSGSSINLEIVRSLANGKYAFKNTIHVVWFVGEEQGLFGSRWLAQHYKSEDAPVIAMFNNDMVGYTDKDFGITLSFMNGSRSESLTASCKDISKTYLPTLAVADTNVCCSDQQSFYESGFEAAGIFETPTDRAVYPEYHKSNDQYDNGLINYDQIYQFGQANFACLLSYAVPIE